MPWRYGGNRGTSSLPGCCSVLLCALFFLPAPSEALDAWGGSASLTSDYVVRGISRSDNEAALQLDGHYLSSFGFFAGVSASTVRIDPREGRNVELSGYLGYAWDNSNDWHARATFSHYAYPWDTHGSVYDYDELLAQVGYQGWVQLSASYAPNYPRYLPRSWGARVSSAGEESIELNLQRPVLGRLSLIAGVGYANIGGPSGDGYVYYSLGAAIDIGPFSLAAAYIDTSYEAKTLFYNAAADRRFVGTIIWRF